MTRFAVKTLGCKVNQCDTQALREELLRRGCVEVSRVRDARLIIVNTCCVTHPADRKSRQAVRQAAREKKRGARLAVVGCYPAYDKERVCGIPGVDAVFVDAGRRDFWAWAERRIGIQKAGRGLLLSRFSGRTRAFLKIQEGCDNRCSYCVVPFVRGPSRSLAFDAVVERGRRLVAAGHKEIVLTGTNLGAYRRAGRRCGLIDVVDALSALPDLARLRLSSIEAPDVTDALISRMASSPKLCPHLHIPFQSGDDAVLRHMGKRVRVADYLRLAQRLRRRVPDASITCDIIVGYPLESAASFCRTCSFLKEIGPLKTHIFTFSSRKGTRLDAMGQEPLDPLLVKERRLELDALTHRFSRSHKERFLGRTMEVLMEEERSGQWEGYTGNYVRVSVRSDSCRPNSLYPVVIESIAGEEVSGRICLRKDEFSPKNN